MFIVLIIDYLKKGVSIQKLMMNECISTPRKTYTVNFNCKEGNVDPLYCPSVLFPIRSTAHPTYCNI